MDNLSISKPCETRMAEGHAHWKIRINENFECPELNWIKIKSEKNVRGCMYGGSSQRLREWQERMYTEK